LSGVVAVINRLCVESPTAATEVKEQIERALHRSAQLEASRIRVEASGGRVTLRGTVHDRLERDLIERAAWSVPDLTEIHDRLTIEP
jgi:osmotically-inducible protein OsmY